MGDIPGKSFSELSSRQGQRRYLTVLFADMAGSTRISQALDAEYFGELLVSWRNHSRKTIEKFGGRIARLQGDGLLAIFGFPQARETDGASAVDAALELHSIIAKVGELFGHAGLALHTGIHSGLVYMSDGDIETGRFEVVGAVPNLAARLSMAAQHNEILVSHASFGPFASRFELVELGNLVLRGFDQPVASARVVRRKAATELETHRITRRSTPFAGRSRELALLTDALKVAQDGGVQRVSIVGAPGLGKTRFVEEFLRLHGAGLPTVLRGFCDEQVSSEPFHPFLQMLRSVCGIRPEDSRAEAVFRASAQLRKFVSLSNTAVADLMALLQLSMTDSGKPAVAASPSDALLALFNALASDRLLCLVFDDWQWSDDASRQVLDALHRRQSRLLIVVATRESIDQVALESESRRIELQPLNTLESNQTVTQLLPGAGPFMVAEITRHAGGNPLYIEELCHHAQAEGLNKPIARWQSGAAWLNSLIESRFERLPPIHARVVEHAAVCGNSVPVWLLERLLTRAVVQDVLGTLADMDFLYPSEQGSVVRFKHGIARGVIYEAIGIRVRQDLHRRIAELLLERSAQYPLEDQFEALAFHYGAAGQYGEAARFAELAGDRALSASSLDRATRQYEIALAFMDTITPRSDELHLRWCKVAEKLGMSCVFDPISVVNGEAIFEQGVRLARSIGTPDLVARAEYWLGYYCYARGLAHKGKHHCELALHESLRTSDVRLIAQMRATLGQVRHSLCEYDSAIQLFDQSLDAKRINSRPGGSIAVGAAYTLACKGGILGDRGDFGSAYACFDAALVLLGDSRHQVSSSVQNWNALVKLWQGRWQDALDICQRSMVIAEHVRSTQLLAHGRATMGYCEWMINGSSKAIDTMAESISWTEARGDTLLTSMIYGWLVEALIQVGDLKQARRHAARLLLRARKIDRIGEPMGLRALSRQQMAEGDLPRALSYLDRADVAAAARQSRHESAVNAFCRGELLLLAGQPDTARGHLRTAVDSFRSMGMHWHLQRAQRLLPEGSS